MAFAFITEYCSDSQRNGVRLQTGIAFIFDRIPQAAKKKSAKPVTAAKDVAAKKVAAKTVKRVISAEGRKRIAEAQRKRWAKKKNAKKTVAKKATAAPVAIAAAKEAPKA